MKCSDRSVKRSHLNTIATKTIKHAKVKERLPVEMIACKNRIEQIKSLKNGLSNDFVNHLAKRAYAK